MKTLLFTLIIFSFAASADLPLCEIQVDAKYTTQSKSVDQGGAVGALVSPVECAPIHAILVLGGSEGGIPERFAKEMAARGLVALGLGYFGVKGLKPNIDLLPLEYFDNGLKVLRDLAPQAMCCAVIGASKGAEPGLAFSSYLKTPIAGLILISGSSSAFEGFAGATTTQASSWTVASKPIAFTPYVNPDEKLLSEMFPQGFDKPPVFGPLYRASLDAPEGARGLLPIENVQGPILFLSGRDDRMWPASSMSDTAVARAKAKRFPFAIEHVALADTGHILPNGEYVLGLDDYYPVQFGGTVEGSRQSSPLGRAKIAEFLKAAFAH